MRRLMLAAIRAYQRYVSPHKGFSCAYRVHTGRRGCSALACRAIRIHGSLAGLAVLRKRLHLCGVAYRRFAAPPLLAGPHARQRGHCDLPCDLSPHAAGECLDCAGSALDLGSCINTRLGCCGGRGRKREQEQHVYIPPNTRR
jgi:putative component of membrane protein insertase Oxa1/YidC/SpoIIIJ protein YidD